MAMVLGSDQDFVNGLSATIRQCTLPATKFIGHCSGSHDKSAPLNQLITYHTNCVSGFDAKMRKMKEVLAAAKGPGSVGLIT